MPPLRSLAAFFSGALLLIGALPAQDAHAMRLVSSTTISVPDTTNIYGSGLGVGSTGSIFFGGFATRAGTLQDSWLGKFDAGFQIISSAAFDAGFNRDNGIRDIKVVGSTAIWVTGYAKDAANESNLWVGHYDQNLVLVASATFIANACIGGLPCASDGYDIIVTPGGDVFAVGETEGKTLIVKFSSTLVFQTSVAVTTGWAITADQDPQGNIYMGGSDAQTIIPQLGIFEKYSSALVLISSRAISDPDTGFIDYTLRTAADGSIWAAPMTFISVGGRLLKFDQNLSAPQSAFVPFSPLAIELGSDGLVWLGGGSGAVAKYGTDLILISSAVVSPNDVIRGMVRDSDDTMWVMGYREASPNVTTWLGRVIDAPDLSVSPPTALSIVDVGASSFTVSWRDASLREARFLLSTGSVSGPTNIARTILSDTSASSGTLISYDVVGLSSGTRYFVRLRAAETPGGLIGGYSAEVIVDTASLPEDISVSSPMALSIIDVGISSFTLSWRDASLQEDSFLLSTGAVSGPTNIARTILSDTSASSGTLVSYEVVGLSSATRYFVRLRAANIPDGLIGGYSTELIVDTANLSAPVDASGAAVSITAPAGPAIVHIPPNAFSNAVNVTLNLPSSYPGTSTSGSLIGTGVGLEITLDQAVQPAVAAAISLHYQESDVAGLDRSRLLIARYDTTRGIWIPLLSNSDTSNRRVTAATSHFSLFQIMQAAQTNTVSTIKIYPNPLRPAQGHTAVTFANLPGHTRLRIYTRTGALIRDLSADSAGMTAWDGKNGSGIPVASGVYLVLAQGAGETKTFQVAVQR